MNERSSDLEVICADDCGNSPKKKLLRDLSIACAKHDLAYCLQWMVEDVEWEIVGKEQVIGKNNVEKAWHQMLTHQVQTLHIRNIITHGNTASLDGTWSFGEQHRVAFCHVYQFQGFGPKAKIKSMTSYIIE